MPQKDLSKEEKEKLDRIINDFLCIFKKKKIGLAEIDDLEEELGAEEVKKYLCDLRAKSQPEAALKDNFLVGQPPFAKFLSCERHPEVSIRGGFIDYRIKVKGHRLCLEVKPPLSPKRKMGKWWS